MFDIVTITDSIWFCNNYDIFFNDVKRILKPGGYFIMNESQLDINNKTILLKHFKNTKTFNITDNILKSCKNIIDNIETFDLSQEEKNYILWCSKDNFNNYQNSRFIKYVCKKD